MVSHRLLIRFNKAPKGVMELFTSLQGSNNYVISKTTWGVVEIISVSSAAYVCLLARMQSNKIEFREFKKNYSNKI